jgi:hypothetical protein
MVDRDRILEWLRALDLSEVALTAAIERQGNLRAVGGVWSMLKAAAEDLASLKLLCVVGTAVGQDDVPVKLLEGNASDALRVIQGRTLEQIPLGFMV